MEPLTSLERLGSSAAEEQDRLADGVADLETEKRRFLAAPAPRRSRSSVVWLAVAAAAIVLCTVVLILRNGRDPAPLTFRIGDSRALGEPDAWLSSPSNAPLALGFSDGTSVTLEPNARARVTKVGPAGATVLVERGRASLSVVKRKGAAWRVSLGPFRVDVTGTRFDIDWDPGSENISLDMYEGSVVVSGCVFGGGRPFTAGESMRASCRDQHVEISKLPVDSATRPAQPAEREDERASGQVPPSAASAPVVEGSPSSSTGRHGSEPGPSAGTRGTPAAAGWRDLVKAGRHGEALDAAEAAGFSAECASASAADLVSLGDAARYVGRLDRATEAYETTRRRFPGNERSAVAAFALGRIAFDQRGNYSDAARWFRTYLAEQPGGRLARDALGRLVEALQRAGDAVSARREAAHYLELYPTGPHAEFARRVMGE
jgi:transmembrane sensor